MELFVAVPNRIACPLCQASIKSPALPPGAMCNCPKCGGQFRVPGGEATSGASAEEGDFFELPPKPASAPAPVAPQRQSAEAQESYPELVAAEADEPLASDLAVLCQLCGSRYYASSDKLGQQVTCPDCHTKNTVKRPAPTSKKADVVLTGDEYSFVDEPLPPRPATPLVPTPLSIPSVSPGELPQAIIPPLPAPVVEPPRPRGEGNISKELAASMLAKAEAELEEREPDDIQVELQSFFHGTVSSLAQGQGIALLLMLSVGMTVLTFIGRYVLAQFAEGLNLEQILGIGAMTIGLIILPVVLGPLAAACQAIIQDSANGLKRVQSWPTLSFFEWLGEAALFLAASFAAAAPGLLLLSPSFFVITYPGLIVPGVILISMWALFPIVFLSMADAGSVLAFATPKILRSFGRSGERWFLFYFVSVLLAFGGYFAIAVMLATNSSFVVPLCCAALIAGLFVYSRWLGRLALFIAKDEADAAEKAERTQRYIQRVA
jgi:hypothetical protein